MTSRRPRRRGAPLEPQRHSPAERIPAVHPVVPADIHTVVPADVRPVVPANLHPVVPAAVRSVVPAAVRPSAPADVRPVVPAGVRPVLHERSPCYARADRDNPTTRRPFGLYRAIARAQQGFTRAEQKSSRAEQERHGTTERGYTNRSGTEPRGWGLHRQERHGTTGLELRKHRCGTQPQDWGCANKGAAPGVNPDAALSREELLVEHEPGEERGELIGRGVQRQDVRDVLVGAHHNDHTAGVNATLGEDVGVG